MAGSLTENLLKARLLVAMLGESASPPWWRSQATSPTGQRLLARLYPRTYVSAGAQTAGRAARREHDARIGRVGAFHLFRLPSADESLIAERLGDLAFQRRLGEIVALPGIEERLGLLKELAGRAKATVSPGPVLHGTIDELRSGVAFGRICATYAAAFRTGSPSYPYLEDRTG